MDRRSFSFGLLKSFGAGLVACLSPALKLPDASAASGGTRCLEIKMKQIMHFPKGWNAIQSRNAYGNIPHVDWVDDSWNHVKDGLPPVSGKIYECLTRTNHASVPREIYRARRIPHALCTIGLKKPEPYCWENGSTDNGEIKFFVLWGVEYWRETI